MCHELYKLQNTVVRFLCFEGFLQLKLYHQQKSLWHQEHAEPYVVPCKSLPDICKFVHAFLQSKHMINVRESVLAARIRSLCWTRYVEYSGPLEGSPPEGVGVFCPLGSEEVWLHVTEAQTCEIGKSSWSLSLSFISPPPLLLILLNDVPLSFLCL